MKKILVMGGKRLVGKRLVQSLLEEGHDVTVANRSGISDAGKNVRNIVFDRNNEESIKDKISRQNWDIVYDMICYSPQNAKDMIDNISAEKYILISSSVVYEWGEDHREEDFNASEFRYYDGTIDELGKQFGYKQGYKLGKMGAEAVVTKSANSTSTVCVRFPLIIGGVDDHTKRMETYVNAIKRKQGIYIDNLYSRVSMVEAGNAAEYLRQIKDKKFEGAINICDSDTVTILDLIKIMQNMLENEIIYRADGIIAGYNNYYSNTYNLNKMQEIGIIPQKLDLKAVLEQII